MCNNIVLLMFDDVISGCGTTLTGCWSDLLLAVARKPEAVSHVVSIRAGLTGMSSEVRSPFSETCGVLVFLHLLCTCSYNMVYVLVNTEEVTHATGGCSDN